jgi:hypothetical protein
MLSPILFFSWVCQTIKLAFGSSFGDTAANAGNYYTVPNIYDIKDAEICQAVAGITLTSARQTHVDL